MITKIYGYDGSNVAEPIPRERMPITAGSQQSMEDYERVALTILFIEEFHFTAAEGAAWFRT